MKPMAISARARSVSSASTKRRRACALSRARDKAHARRPFAELAHEGDARAGPIIELYPRLYAVEARATEENVAPEERLRRRQHESTSIVDAIVATCVEIRGRYPPTDPLSKAAGRTSMCLGAPVIEPVLRPP
jgi:hypothetical protein